MRGQDLRRRGSILHRLVTMLIIEATREDLDGLIRLNHEVSLDKFTREMWQVYLKPPYSTFVVKDPAKQGNNPIAYIVLDNSRESVVEIVSLAVEREYQTKSVATKLAQYILSNEYNTKPVVVRVRKKSLRTIAFYNSIGFDIVEIIKSYYTEPNDDALLMKRVY